MVITIDAINSTTLDDEYLLNSSGNLTIIGGINDIPINKHGSGVKRLVLLIFFRAEAERMRAANNHPSVIYAIEKPETSQHVHHQKLLINALVELSREPDVQVILTTHSGFIVKHLNYNHPKIRKMRCLRKGNCNSPYKKWKC